MNYTVRRQFHWRGKVLNKDDIITPETSDESRRLNTLAQEKMVMPKIDADFYDKLDAAGVKMGRVVRPVCLSARSQAGQVAGRKEDEANAGKKEHSKKG